LTPREGAGPLPALLLDFLSYAPIAEDAKRRNAPGNVWGCIWNSSVWTKVAQIQTVHLKGDRRLITILTTTKRFALLLALMAATLLATIMVVYVTTAHPAQAIGSVAVDTSPGTAAPPATLGPYTMTPFAPDDRPLRDNVGTVPAPEGNLLFNQPVEHRRIGQFWFAWSHGYSGDVYSTNGATILDLIPPANTTAFYFNAEPSLSGVFNFTATASDGTTSGPIQVQSPGGAKYFGFYSADGTTLSTIRVESTEGFAVGEFGIAYGSTDTTPPTVADTSPEGNKVSKTANVRATFSEDMQEASLMNAFKLFKKGSTNQIAAQVTYDAATDTAKLNPTNNLKRGATYKAVVSTVAKDEAGNRLDQDASRDGLQQKKWFFEIDN